METSMAANAAKIEVLGSRRSDVSVKTKVTDGMMAYFEGQRAAASKPHSQDTKLQVPMLPVRHQHPYKPYKSQVVLWLQFTHQWETQLEEEEHQHQWSLPQSELRIRPASQQRPWQARGLLAPVIQSIETSIQSWRNKMKSQFYSFNNSVCLQCPRRRFMFLMVIHSNITL